MNFPVAAILALCSGAAASQAAPQDLGISGVAGFQGRCLRGERTPVQVEIDNRGPDRDIVLALTWASIGTRQKAGPALQSLADRRGPLQVIPVSLAAGSRKVISATLVAPDGEAYSVWAYASTPDGKPLAAAEFAGRLVPRSTRLVAVVGDDRPAGLDLPLLEIARVRPSELPEDWKAYAGLDALIWLDGSASNVRAPAQLDALRTWVSSGGHLVVARSNLVGLEKTPVAEMLPVSVQGTKDIAGLSSLGPLWLDSNEPPVGTCRVVASRPVRGRTLFEEESLPLAVEARQDAGRVTFVAFDPSRAPFLGWRGAGAFWRKVLYESEPKFSATEDDLPPPRVVGSSPLTRVAASFPDVGAPAITGLIVLIGLYILAVGPVDYVVLRMLRRLELTWFTFPALVFTFTALILLFGGAFVRRASFQREIAVVDYYEDTGFCRRAAIGAVLAPSDTSYSFTDATPISSNLLTRRISSDYSDGLAEVVLTRGPREEGTHWNILRGYTGLLLTERCSTERPPLDYRIVATPGDSLEVEFRNDTGADLEGAILATSKGLYSFPRIPRGRNRLVAAARENLASAPALPPRNRAVERYDYEESSRGVPEATLNEDARRLLLAFTLVPSGLIPKVERPEGLAARLNASPWLEAGGSVLLAARATTDTVLDIRPTPGRRTAYVFTRVFKGPAK